MKAVNQPAPSARPTPADPTDVELLLLARAGNRIASCALLERHEGFFHAVAREYAPDPTQADDILQECRIHLLAQLHHYDPTRPLKPWLQTVVRNCARNYCRSARRWRARPYGESEPEVAAVTQDAGERLTDAETAATLRQLVSELPDLYRTVIVRKYFQEHSCETIASALKLPIGTVKNRLFRARQLLQDRLTRMMPSAAAA